MSSNIVRKVALCWSSCFPGERGRWGGGKEGYTREGEEEEGGADEERRAGGGAEEQSSATCIGRLQRLRDRRSYARPLCLDSGL